MHVEKLFPERLNPSSHVRTAIDPNFVLSVVTVPFMSSGNDPQSHVTNKMTTKHKITVLVSFLINTISNKTNYKKANNEETYLG